MRKVMINPRVMIIKESAPTIHQTLMTNHYRMMVGTHPSFLLILK